MKKRSIVLILGIVLCFTCMWLQYSEASSEIDMVRSGVLFGNQTTTIGAVLDGSFDNPKWENFETDKGQHVVEFSGKISAALHQAAVEALASEYSAHDLYRYCATYGDYTNYKGDPADMGQRIRYFMDTQWWPVGSEASIQFLIHVNGETFQIGGLYSDVWRGLNENFIMETIYK